MEQLSHAFQFEKDVHEKNNKPKWWNRQIEAGLLHKKYAHNKYLSSQNENDKIEYERIRREKERLDEAK